jgi:hypothetical protein
MAAEDLTCVAVTLPDGSPGFAYLDENGRVAEPPAPPEPDQQ